jgi:hypothetical protein
VFKLTGPGHTIATKVKHSGNYDNCLGAAPVIDACFCAKGGGPTGSSSVSGEKKHSISLKLARGEASHFDMYCGVVKDGTACDKDPSSSSGSDKGGADGAWLMYRWPG